MVINNISKKALNYTPIDITCFFLTLLTLSTLSLFVLTTETFSQTISEDNDEKFYLSAQILTSEIKQHALSEEFKLKIQNTCNVKVNTIQELLFLKYHCESYDTIIEELPKSIQESLEKHFRGNDQFEIHKLKVFEKRSGGCFSIFDIRDTLTFGNELNKQHEIAYGNLLLTIPNEKGIEHLILCKELSR